MWDQWMQSMLSGAEGELGEADSATNRGMPRQDVPTHDRSKTVGTPGSVNEPGSANATGSASISVEGKQGFHRRVLQFLPEGFLAVMGVMEWWRWLLIGAGASCVLISLLLLVQIGQVDGTTWISSSLEQTSQSAARLSSQNDQIPAQPPAGSTVLVADAGSVAGSATSDTSNTATTQTASSGAEKSVGQTEQVAMIYVDVSGAVAKPGVHLVEKTARAGSAVSAAGGLTRQAHQVYLRRYFNAAEPIRDGQKIYIPFMDEEIESLLVGGASARLTAESSDSTSSDSSTGPISINSATATQLDALPGIGAVRAQQIVDGRPYSSLAELESKDILTPSVYAGLAGLISL